MRNVYIGIYVLLLMLLSVAASSPLRAQDQHLTLKTVVIDAGHGGNDPGCISKDKKTQEKALTLSIAKQLAAKIRAAHPDVRVILTRDSDKYVTLGGRADIANEAGADLFISIHINSVDKGTKANGFSIHCLGQSSRKGNDLFDKNLELCRRENSVILLEDNHETEYQGFDPNDPQSYIFFSLIQNANLGQSLLFAEDVNEAMKGGPIAHSRGVSQDPFLVLSRTTMPAVLIECGFMSNPSDLTALRSKAGQAGIAERLLKAFSTFKKRYDGDGVSTSGQQASSGQQNASGNQEESSSGEAADTTATDNTVAGNDSGTAKESTVFYGTQILAIKKPMKDSDPFFKGYKPVRVEGETLTRYIIGTAVDKSEAKRKNAEIRKKFLDSFFVRVEDGTVSREK